MAGDPVKHDPRTGEVFVMEICSSRGMKLLTQPSSSSPSSTMSAQSPDETHEFSVAQHSIFFTFALARRSCVVTGDNPNSFVEASLVICLPGGGYRFPILLP